MERDLIGQTLGGRYRVEQFIDQGGMASVYRVLDLESNALLALKTLKPDLAEDTVFLRRFGREALVLQRLEHPNIVRFYGLEPLDGHACLLLEYIDGITLRRRIFELGGALPIKEIRSWLKPVCLALHYAHQMGIYHCDVKPANIMVTRQGRVVLSDFGIARSAGGTVATISTPGTPEFMAPEQWLGGSLDARTDLYALGVTLYSMMTGGERPFCGESPQSEGDRYARIQWEHLFLPPPSPRLYNPAIGEGLASMVAKALAKNPNDRFQTAADFYRAFEDSISAGTIYPAPPVPAPVRMYTPPQRAVVREIAPVPATQTPSSRLKWGIFTAVAGVVLVMVLVLALGAAGAGGNPTNPVGQISPQPQQSLPVAPGMGQISPQPQQSAPIVSGMVSSNGIYVEYIVSSANSMLQDFGGVKKQEVVRNVLSQHWNLLPPDTGASLRVFGSQFSAADETNSCRDTKLLATSTQGVRLTSLLDGLEARGLAALYETMYATSNDFTYTGRKNYIVLITDSGDTCGQDTCEWARSMYVDAGLQLPIHVIDLGGGGGAKVKCLADLSKGTYQPISDQQGLTNALQAIQAEIFLAQ